MLLYPAMKELLKNIPSRYLLVNIVAARARKISSEAEQEGISLEDKPVTLAIREVASGALRLDNAEMAEEEAQSAVDAPEQEGEGSPATAEDEE